MTDKTERERERERVRVREKKVMYEYAYIHMYMYASLFVKKARPHKIYLHGSNGNLTYVEGRKHI